MFPNDNNQAPQFQPAQQQPVQQQPQQPQYQQPAPQAPDYTQQPQNQPAQQQPASQEQQQVYQQPANPGQQPQPGQQPAQQTDPNFIPAGNYGYMPDNSDFAQSQQNQQQVPQTNGDQQFGQQDPNQQQPQQQQQQPQFDPNNPQGQQPQQQYGQPQTPFAPTAQPQQVVQNIQAMEQNFEVWLDQEYPMPELPNINDIAQDDPAALQNFFVEYDAASRGRVAVEAERRELKSAKDEILWQEVHAKYGNLRNAPNVLQTVKQMYEGARSMGNAVTPLQVVDQYVGTLNNNFQRGYQANNTQVQIRQSQPLPNGGGSQTPPTPVVSQQDMNNLNQNGNDVIEDAAAVIRKMRAAGHGGL